MRIGYSGVEDGGGLGEFVERVEGPIEVEEFAFSGEPLELVVGVEDQTGTSIDVAFTREEWASVVSAARGLGW